MNLTVCSYDVTYGFQSESTLYIFLNIKEVFAQKRRDIWSLSDCNETRTHNHLLRKGKLNHLPKLTKWLNWVVSSYLSLPFDCMLLSCPYAFQTESTLYICVNFKQHLSRKRPEIWSSSDWNRTRTHDHLIRKWTLNHLVELTKWLNWVVTTYLHVAFDCMFLSCPYAFQIKFRLDICLNVNDLLPRNRRDISNLSGSNGTKI